MSAPSLQAIPNTTAQDFYRQCSVHCGVWQALFLYPTQGDWTVFQKDFSVEMWLNKIFPKVVWGPIIGIYWVLPKNKGPCLYSRLCRSSQNSNVHCFQQTLPRNSLTRAVMSQSEKECTLPLAALPIKFKVNMETLSGQEACQWTCKNFYQTNREKITASKGTKINSRPIRTFARSTPK